MRIPTWNLQGIKDAMWTVPRLGDVDGLDDGRDYREILAAEIHEQEFIFSLQRHSGGLLGWPDTVEPGLVVLPYREGLI